MTVIELLHCIGCESPTGDKHMDMLLDLAGIGWDELNAHTMPDKSAQRELRANPLQIGTPAPEMLAFN